MEKQTVNVVSLGAGVQSTTMLLMAARGELGEKPDFAVFSDTGWEPKHVMKHLEWLKAEVGKYGVEVIITNNGNIRDDLIASVNGGKRFASLPFFIINEDGTQGISRRQCTNEYKIQPVRKAIRTKLGYVPRQRVKENVRLWMGISTDEIQRVKPSRDKWIENYYPLIENNMSRGDCLDWMRKNGYPRPPKSSCIGCPFHNDLMWLDMKENDPEAFADAVFIDGEIKKLPRFKGQAFLHRAMVPLDQVDFKARLQNKQMDLINDFINECEGMCGV